MTWPAGLVQKMSYADRIEKTLTDFMKNSVIPSDTKSTEYMIIERWMEYKYGKS